MVEAARVGGHRLDARPLEKSPTQAGRSLRALLGDPRQDDAGDPSVVRTANSVPPCTLGTGNHHTNKPVCKTDPGCSVDPA